MSNDATISAGSKDDLPFERLGRYHILKRIGRGGMGDVYLGYEDDLKRQVAIKVLPAELTRSEDFVRRFRAEAAAVARLEHPNIVPIYFIGHDAGCHYFVMEYVEAKSLDHLLARRGRLGAGETLAILEQCLAGLGEAHRAGLVHRDVKPGNVLLEAESGRSLVADFGLVKVTNAQSGVTATGVVLGTVDYIPPEQARGQEVDGRSDLYSVGVMAYQMLSGRLPFAAKTPTATLFQHAYETPQPLGEAAPDVPQPLAALADKLMAKDPAARYQSCEEALADLQRVRAGEQAPRPSQIIQAPDFGRPPELAGLQLPSPGNWWRRVRDRAADLFQAHAPEFVKDLQSTGQQVDGALAEYQRRRDRLARLVGEAQLVIEELTAQAKSHREAAAAAARRAASAAEAELTRLALKEKEECERSAGELDRQVTEQQAQLEQMRRNLAKVDATLGGLRSQRDLLMARLRVAEARLNVEGGRRLPRRRWLVPAAVLLGLAAVAGVFWLVFAPSQPTGNQPPAPPPTDLFKDAVLHMTFAKDTFYEKEGKTYVRDLSGSGYDGLCDGVAFTSEGKTGGGLKYDGTGCLRIPTELFNHQANYTITAWVRLQENAPDCELFQELSQKNDLGICVTSFLPNGRVFSGAFNRTTKGFWSNNTTDSVIPYEKWFFVALALQKGGVETGSLRVTVDGQEYHLPSQMVDEDTVGDIMCVKLGRRLEGMLGEISVFHRFLSAGEIEAIRQRGVGGERRARAAQPAAAPIVVLGNEGQTASSFVGHTGAVNSVCYSGDGRRALSGSIDGTVRLWDADSGKELRRFEAADTRSVALSGDGRRVLIGGGGPRAYGGAILLDADSGKEICRFPMGQSWSMSVALSTDGRRALVDGLWSTFVLWDVDTGKEVRRYTSPGPVVSSVALSFDGRHALSGSDHETVFRLWDVEKGTVEQVFKGHTGAIKAVAFSPDGRRALSGAEDGTLRLWDVSNGQPLRQYKGHTDSVNSVAFTGDGLRVLSGGSDQTVRLWDVNTGKQLRCFTGHTGAVQSVAVTPDGRRALSGSNDKTVRLWSLPEPDPEK